MCDHGVEAAGLPLLTRRVFLRRTSTVALALPLLPLLPGRAAAAPLPLAGVAVRPREDWARGLVPIGPLTSERPGDVRFLLVHHTASPNTYAPDAVPDQIRGFYAMHTGPSKNWPDVAYNFFVDRYGTVWEGRAGSLSGPVQPDATGGSQGFAQLCCFIGDHSTEAPTEEARRSMVALLAALADVYGIDTAPGATADFVSRGSNRWPAGTPVTAATISGHRDMSLTACPGDAAYPLVRDVFPAEVTALRTARSTPAPAPPPPAPAATSAAGATTAAGTTAAAEAGGTAVARASWTTPALLASGGALAAAAATGLAVRHRRRASAVSRRAPAAGDRAWRVEESAGTADTGGEPPVRSAGTVHERGTSALVAVVATADRPSPAVRAALNGGRLAAREVDQQAQHWEHDPERAAALVLARSVRAGHTAARGQTPALRVAVVVVLGGTVTLVTTDESMGAVLTVGGTVLRPVPVRPAAPGGASSLHSVSSTESDAATAVIASPTPPSSRDAAAAERLPDLCRRLSTTSDAARAVAGFEHDHYGATGTPAVVLALVHDAVLPTTASGR